MRGCRVPGGGARARASVSPPLPMSPTRAQPRSSLEVECGGQGRTPGEMGLVFASGWRGGDQGAEGERASPWTPLAFLPAV